MSWPSATMTGTAYFHSNRNETYRKMMISEKRIARYADLSTDWPNDELTLRRSRPLIEPNRDPSSAWSLSDCAVVRKCDSISNRVKVLPCDEPVAVRPFTTGSDTPAADAAEFTWATVAGFPVLKSIFVPPVKSIPSFRPVVARATAPITITTPEIANQSFALPMKSYFFQRSPEPTAPSTRGELMNRTPIRSISAKPLTDDVAAAYRMPAVMSVTTLASMIVWKPRR